jgi:amino acid transporter
MRRLTVLPLAAATFFVVSGGPYGLEELLARAGYRDALIVLAATPLIWSVPTALMVAELSSALPQDGGYYRWVERALGRFWGFQEAWLSLVASFVDVAIYPTLFLLYLGRLVPAAASGLPGLAIGVAVIAACVFWNIGGAKAVTGGSILLGVALLVPFAFLAVGSLGQPAHPVPQHPHGGLIVGMLIAMWNYMGWDNISTIAGEVERPHRSYPRALLLAMGLIVVSYFVPVLAIQRAGIDPGNWTTGAWVDAGVAIGGRWLGLGIVVGGMVCAVGMFNALVMSYSRLPMALADDGLLPACISWRHPRSGAPWVAIALCSVIYAACLGFGFNKLVELDVIIYGLSLLLEFIALVVLRLKEPDLARPFRVPGGLCGALLVGVMPISLLVLAALRGRYEEVGTVNTLALSLGVVALGPPLYGLSSILRRARTRIIPVEGANSDRTSPPRA